MRPSWLSKAPCPVRGLKQWPSAKPCNHRQSRCACTRGQTQRSGSSHWSSAARISAEQRVTDVRDALKQQLTQLRADLDQSRMSEREQRTRADRADRAETQATSPTRSGPPAHSPPRASAGAPYWTRACSPAPPVRGGVRGPAPRSSSSSPYRWDGRLRLSGCTHVPVSLSPHWTSQRHTGAEHRLCHCGRTPRRPEPLRDLLGVGSTDPGPTARDEG